MSPWPEPDQDGGRDFHVARLVLTLIMLKSIPVITKRKRGRPVTTGRGTLIGVRLLAGPLAALDAWITAQDEPGLSRPEAIRRLVDRGLSRSSPSERLYAAWLGAASEKAE
jgi:hypothetical protein